VHGVSAAYRTIVADPPWPYDGFATAPTIKREAQRVRVTGLPYKPMSLDAIKALPVGGLADPASNCRLFLWATNRYLPSAFDILAAWGFAYRQTMVWHKTGNPSPFGGSVAPNHAEFLLVAAKGTPEVLERLPSSVVAAPAAAPGKRPGSGRSHSAKPDLFLDLIERCSPGPYVELFARRARFGWDYFGDESLGTAELPAA
jgi:N6-adenosine-specific RNA methylase IME4